MIDAIVLAAGKNERLRGYVPAYMKPLILVDGSPLILTIVKNLLSFEEIHRVIVVVAPHNAAAITDVLSSLCKRIDFIVQPEAKGPAEAVMRALPLVECEGAIIVCGDNVVPRQDIEAAALSFSENNGQTTVITCKLIHEHDKAMRFTRVTKLRLYEHVSGGELANGTYQCWVGPVVVNASNARDAFKEGVELISTALNDIGPPFTVVHGDSHDIGVPDALLRGSNDA